MIGTVQALALASGFLFVSLYRGNLGGLSSLLFGNFLGITRTEVVVLGCFGALAMAVLAAIGRPLRFASIDPDAAAGRGVPVRVLSISFLLLLGVAAAAIS